jgi:synaptic vesicle membrane protein VAT-1
MAPGGVDAVFDHLDGSSFRRSFKRPAPGATLAAYGMAANRDDTSNVLLTFVGLNARIEMWNPAPNGRRAFFYNLWGGKLIHSRRFWPRMASALTSVFSPLAEGVITPYVPARMPLTDAGRAMTLAESKTVYGKVTLVP